MIEKKPHKITVINSDGMELSLTLPWDAGIDNWVDSFKVILRWVTFDENQIKEYFIDEDECPDLEGN